MKPLPDIILKGGRLPSPDEFDDYDSYLAFCRAARIRQERKQTIWTLVNLLAAIIFACLLCYGLSRALDAIHRYLHPLS